MAEKQLGTSPSNSTDAATKTYVDTAISSITSLPISSTGITDATETGRSLLKANSKAAARAAINANHYINVADYAGIDLTGATDSSTAFQNILNEAKAAATATGGIAEVYIPPGILSINIRADIGAGVTVRGANRDLTKVISSNANGTFRFTGKSDMAITNLTVEGPTVYPAIGIYGNHPSRVQERISVTHCAIVNVARGIMFNSGAVHQLTISDNYLDGCSMNGTNVAAPKISWGISSQIIIARNRYRNIGGSAIQVYGGRVGEDPRISTINGVIICDNDMRDFAPVIGDDETIPIEPTGITNLIVSGNTIVGPWASRGITMGNNINSIIANNVIVDQTVYAFEISSGRNMVITGNVAENCRTFAWNTSGPLDDNLSIPLSDIVIENNIYKNSITEPGPNLCRDPSWENNYPLVGNRGVLTGKSVAVTQASGNGTTATLTLASNAEFSVGETITVADIPGYNGTYTVTAASSSAPFTVSYALAVTGSKTVSGGSVFTTMARTGTQSLKIVGDGTSNSLYRYIITHRNDFVKVPCVAGDSFLVSAWVYGNPTNQQTSGGTDGLSIRADCFDSSGNYITNRKITATASTALNGVWTEISGTLTMPASTTSASFYVSVDKPTAQGETYYFDDVSVAFSKTSPSETGYGIISAIHLNNVSRMRISGNQFYNWQYLAGAIRVGTGPTNGFGSDVVIEGNTFINSDVNTPLPTIVVHTAVRTNVVGNTISIVRDLTSADSALASKTVIQATGTADTYDTFIEDNHIIFSGNTAAATNIIGIGNGAGAAVANPGLVVRHNRIVRAPRGLSFNTTSTDFMVYGNETLTCLSPDVIPATAIRGPLIDQINDINGKAIIKFSPTSNAVNHLQVTNSAAGSSVGLSATGGDSNVSMNLTTKGSGVVSANNNPVGVKVAIPANATAVGQPGQWAIDAANSKYYICTATNTWKRFPITFDTEPWT